MKLLNLIRDFPRLWRRCCRRRADKAREAAARLLQYPEGSLHYASGRIAAAAAEFWEALAGSEVLR